jgi:hypothetical protein
MEQRELDLKIMRKDHQLLALNLLFREEEVALIGSNNDCTFSVGHLTRIGIVQVSHDGKLNFIHRTFAEYYVADCLVNRLIKWNNLSKQMQDSILRVVFLEEKYLVIRAFIDGLLSRSKMALKECGNRIHDNLIYDDKILYVATCERNVNIILFLLESVNSDHTDTENKLLLKKMKGG